MSKHFLISRTDAIGDVVLTLPLAGIIKAHFPKSTVSFLGNTYTKDVISASTNVDNFLDYNDWTALNDDEAAEELKSMEIDTIIHVFPNMRISKIAQKAAIKNRIGTTNRLYHWKYCNKLIFLSRKNSDLHEAQLNIKLLKGIGFDKRLSFTKISSFYGLQTPAPLDNEILSMLSDSKFNLIIHPKSSGSAQEWNLKHYTELINLLDLKKYKVFITGTGKERVVLADWLFHHQEQVIDMTDKFTLLSYQSFVNSADGLIAASTGPVHLAAAYGTNTLGLYANGGSVNAKRWAPVGKKAGYIEAANGDINSITPEKVFNYISDWIK